MMGKDHKQTLPIAGDGRRGMGVFGMELGKTPLADRHLPKQLAGLLMQRQNRLLLLYIIRSRQEDAISDDRRTGMAAAGEWGFPGDILGGAEFGRGAGGLRR